MVSQEAHLLSLAWSEACVLAWMSSQQNHCCMSLLLQVLCARRALALVFSVH